MLLRRLLVLTETLLLLEQRPRTNGRHADFAEITYRDLDENYGMKNMNRDHRNRVIAVWAASTGGTTFLPFSRAETREYTGYIQI